MSKVDHWTEIITDEIGLHWFFDGYTLFCVAFTLSDDVYLTRDALDSIEQYRRDKETDLTVNEMYDESDFDGSVQEFVHDYLSV